MSSEELHLSGGNTAEDTGFIDNETLNAMMEKLPEISLFEKTDAIQYSGTLTLNGSGKLLKDYIVSEGFGDHHIQVYDNWIFRSAHANVCGKSLELPGDKMICFDNLEIFPPRYTREGKSLPLTPKLAREQGVTYGSDWHVDIVLKRGGCKGEEIGRRKAVCIGTIPVMIKSTNCILHGKTPRELALMGEDPNDPGGYFIVEGNEKVILLQEQLAVNKIFIMKMNPKDNPEARMTASTVRGTTLIKLVLDNTTNCIEMMLPSMGNVKPGEKPKAVNVLSIFRLFGVADPDEIKDFISLFMEPERIKKSMLKLTRTIVNFSMFTDDIDNMAAAMNKSKLSEDEKQRAVLRVFENDLFPHVNDLPGPNNETVSEKSGRIAYTKIYLLSIMLARYLEHLAGFTALDNRDSWSNKRVEGAGRMMEQLFRNAWRKTLSIAQDAINRNAVKDLAGIAEKIRYSVITDTFRDSFITNNWGVKGMQMKNNIAQTLMRDSVVATFAHINTVDVKISRTDRQQNLRLVQNDQWGFICPASTPEGENAGILKNLSITAKVSLDRSDAIIIRLLLDDENGTASPRVVLNPDVAKQWPDKLLVNGKFLGWCDGEATRDFLILKRREGSIWDDTTIIKQGSWLYVDIGASRLVRPLLIVDEDQQLVIDKLNLRGQPKNVLMTTGAMEYISPWEQEYTKIATSTEVIEKRLRIIQDANETYRLAVLDMNSVKKGKKKDMTIEEAQNRLDNAMDDLEKLKNNKPYTHCELDPLSILGVAAALIPWPDHNQAPRNTYQVSMGKQALGIYHSNHANRFDGTTKVLAFPNRPMVDTEMYNIIGLDHRGPGENVNIAFMAFPFTEEDSFIFKKEFLDNGGFRMYKYITYSTTVNYSGDVIEMLTRPELRQGEQPLDRYKYIQMAEIDNPTNGLPMVGAPLLQGYCVIGKIQKISATGETKNESIFLKVGDEGIVDKVLVTTDNKITTVTVKIRLMRVPREGDKFAPRNAQKGTIGLVMSDIDMPSSQSGLVPDIIVNTHSIPSRMTIEYPMELLSGKYGAMKGTHINATAFRPFEIDIYRQTLKDRNMHEFGYEKMRSGASGELLDALIYSGPVFFQALRHHVKDKVQVRNTGQVKPMTRQPPKGRSARGGLRFGEMERDAAISHGASSFLRERLMLVSDAYQTVFCRTCGSFAVNDVTSKTYRPCKLCENTNFGRCTIPYAYKLLIHLLGAIGINLHPEFITSEEQVEKIFKQKSGIRSNDLNEIRTQLEEADLGLPEEGTEEDIDLDIDYGDTFD